MEAYKDWVRQNRHWVASIESIANTFTWFLPERFTNSEIGTEAVTALIGLATAVNQHIIETTPNSSLHTCNLPVSQVVPLPLDQHVSIPWPLLLSSIKELEVLVEVAAEHYRGRDRKWTVLASVEAIKALLRLIILHKRGYKLLLDGGETTPVEGDSGSPYRESASLGFSTDRERNKRSEGHFSSMYQGGSGGFQDVGRSSGRDMESMAMKALSRFGETIQATGRPSWANSRETTLENTLFRDEIASASKPNMFTVWETKGWAAQFFIIGEVITILRPLVFVLLIRRYGLRSWKPWMASLTVDVTAMCLLLTTSNMKSSSRSSCFSDGQKSLNHHLSVIETRELSRRQLLWALYLLRDPFFSKYTRHPLEKTERLLKPVPIIGMLAGKAVELIVGVQTRYSYTSAS